MSDKTKPEQPPPLTVFKATMRAAMVLLGERIQIVEALKRQPLDLMNSATESGVFQTLREAEVLMAQAGVKLLDAADELRKIGRE